MEFGSINVLAVVVSALVAMAVGFLWFSPPLFEKMWLAGIGKTREEVAGQSPARFLIAFVSALLESYILAALLNIVGGPSIGSALQLAFVIWVSFVAATSAANFAFAGRKLSLWLVENGNHLLVLFVMAVILGAWK